MKVFLLRQRPLVLAAFTAVTLLAFDAAPALADTATFRHPAGPASHAMDNVYRAVLGVTVTIFVLVGGWLLYSALRFRVRRGDPDIEPPQVHGSTRLELGWTLAPVLVLAALAAYTLDNVGTVKDAPSNSMVVDVKAQQFSFSYVYGANSGASGKAPSNATTLVVPVETPVKLLVRSVDVDHDWWVPSLGPKIDAIPGQTNSTWFQADHTGTYTGQCAEFCGLGHATMTITVKVVSKTDWNDYTAKLQRT
ncbi:MAG TPA: cytochrome c oxidase subunit II [Gaiellales bacterium]|nr:cytochrome c oxidase subunit II [Gaiellales bacterium]